MDFRGQVVMVTGGSSGIGRAIALRAAEAQATVVLVARNRQRGEAARRLIAERGGRVRFYSTELGDAQAVRRLLRRVDRELGGLQILVNNAGGGDFALPGADSSAVMEEWNRRARDNLLSAYLASIFAAPLLMRAGGAIVNISSTASLHGTYGLYGAMKAGVEGLTRALAVRYAPFGIRVNAVAPGWIHTWEPPHPEDPAILAWRQTCSLLGRMGEPEEVAEAVLYLASPQASFVTGTTLFVDGGLSISDPTHDGLQRALAQAQASAASGARGRKGARRG